VLVHYPSIFPWIPTPGNQLDWEWGVSSCSKCGYQSKHKLSWPDEAYYASDYRGQTLWAWTRGHAQALKSFVESNERNPWRYPGYVPFLFHVPKVFLLAKNRGAVSKRLRHMLES